MGLQEQNIGGSDSNLQQWCKHCCVIRACGHEDMGALQGQRPYLSTHLFKGTYIRTVASQLLLSLLSIMMMLTMMIIRTGEACEMHRPKCTL